jgi:hypothetical protein
MGDSKGKLGMSYNTEVSELYGVYFRVMNGVLKLTKKELEIASLIYNKFLEIKKDVSNPKIANELLFSTRNRKEIREQLGMSVLLFNNYIKALKEKNIILVNDDSLSVNPNLAVPTSKGVSITFEINVR